VSEAKSINEMESDLFLPEEVDRFSNPVEARKKAMDYLARREYGRLELNRKLSQFGFEPDVAASAVDQLHDDGLQDDRRFAESFLQSRISQGKGPVRTRLDLGERGLDDALIEDVLIRPSRAPGLQGESTPDALPAIPRLRAGPHPGGPRHAW